jgi:hypothetical protein
MSYRTPQLAIDMYIPYTGWSTASRPQGWSKSTPNVEGLVHAVKHRNCVILASRLEVCVTASYIAIHRPCPRFMAGIC